MSNTSTPKPMVADGGLVSGRGGSRPRRRGGGGEGGLWPLCQAVYAVTIPTWLRGVVGTAIPTSRAFLRPREAAG